MKIIFAIKRLETMAGGAERVILQVIEGLKSQYGYDITLISFDRPEAQSFYPIPEGIQWIRLGIGNSARRSGLLETLKRMMYLRKKILELQPDMLIPFQHSMFIPMVFATIGMDKPIIASEHIVPEHYRSHPLEFLLLVLSGLRCRRITVLSDKIMRMYPRCLWSRMVAIPNPVVTSDIPADIVGKGKKTVLSVGRLDAQKDQRTLIDAFAILAKDFPDWNLKIIGEGRLRSELESQILSHRLGGRVALTGITSDILNEYQQAQAFVLSSKYESFGLATAEAMSAGLPVIGFADCPGTNELIIDGQSGILASVRGNESRAEVLARAMKTVFEDVELRRRLGLSARKQIEELNVGRVVALWDSLINLCRTDKP